MNQREALLAAGISVVHRQGFSATGVREIAAEAGLPPGSFTNHFRSKEAFGLQVLDRYFQRLDAIMSETLGDEALDPRERLWAYFDRTATSASDADWLRGCIVVDLAAEVPARSDVIRERLCVILEHQSGQLERVLRSIQPDDPEAAADLGAFLMAAWQGTLLRMKTERSPAAVDRFRRVLERLVGRSLLESPLSPGCQVTEATPSSITRG